MRVLALLLLLPGFIFAGNSVDEKKYKRLWDDANEQYNEEQYSEALKLFLEAYNIDSSFSENANISYRIGECYLHSAKEKVEAIPYLEKAILNVQENLKRYDPISEKEQKAPIDAYRVLGKAYQFNYEFDKAIQVYDKYVSLIPDDDQGKIEKAEAERLMNQCFTAKILVDNPVNIIVTNLGDKVNTKFPEYSPVLSADEKTLIFTARKDNSTGGNIDPQIGTYFEDLYISTKEDDGSWSTPKNMGGNINTDFHEATISLSVDGQQLLIYSDKDGTGDIYISKLVGSDWTAPEKFSKKINGSKSNEMHACFTADGNVIYFTSDRKGGYGGLDIYMVKKMPNGEWSMPQNLGSKINTQFDERAPFIHPDGVTLFFSSEGHKSMGGFDIFQSMQDENGFWMEPDNIGHPINTTDDDVFYVTSTDGKRAYYSSHKDGGMGDQDLYMITLPDKKEKALTVMSGTFSITGENGEVPENAQIVVTDNETNEIVGIYKPNPVTGKYLFILPPGKNYNVTYEAEGYLFKSENLIVPEKSEFSTIESTIDLAPIKAGQSIILNNIFFEFDSAKLTEESLSELEKLRRLLANNVSMKVEIQGHTDSKGNDSYNKRLSQQRAESVVKFLTDKGIEKDRLIAKGYGETQPIAKNENADGSDNPEGRQLNRRTELKILSTDGNPNIVNPIYVPDNLKKK